MNFPTPYLGLRMSFVTGCRFAALVVFTTLFLQSVVPLAAQTGVRINEFMANNNSVLVDNDDEYSDWLELYNAGPSTVDLTGWYLTDDSTHLSKWAFPAISLAAGGYLIVFASDKNLTSPQLHTNFKLTGDGEYLALVRPDTTVIEYEFRPSFPIQAGDVSFGVLGSGLAYFATSSPGAVNAAGAVDLVLTDNDVTENRPNDFYIATIIATDLDTSTSVTYSLIDDAGGRFKIVNNQLQVANSGLLDFDADTSHQITVRAIYDEESFVDKPFTIFIKEYFPVDLEISEFMASNQTTLQDEDGEYSDWLEIHNTGAEAINLENWYLTDSDNNLVQWQFPSRVIPAGGYLVVFASDKNRTGSELHTNFKLSAGGEYLGLVQPNGTVVVSEYAPFPPQASDISYGYFNSTLQFFDVPTPGSANTDGTLPIDPLTISPERGFYETSFDVTITTTTPNVEIRYTLDGSKPTPSNGSVYSGPITIDTTTVLRAAAYQTGYRPTRVETHTYLFLDYVIEQPYNIDGYPVQMYSVGSNDPEAFHDYAMDPTIVNDPAYSGSIIKGLTDIPSMIISLDPDSLFGEDHFYDADDGDIEQRVSMEYLDFHNPNRNDQQDCGIEGHSHDRLKRSLRLSFKSEYGSATWNTNIFRDAPLNGSTADKDQKRIVLRGGNNRSWARKWNPEETTYTEDQWFRDTQIAMSGYGAHGNFVHLYINGIYWGLYNPVERPDQFFSSEYFGGNEEDWYAMNHDGTISGDATRFNHLASDLVNMNMSNSANYAEMQEYLDIDNFIDYMMLNWFGAVTDWPGKNYWGGNQNSPAGPYRFYSWDSEWSWDVTKDFDDVSGAWVHPDHRAGSSESDFQSKIWVALRESSEFMTHFADRVYMHCFNDGVLTDSASLARWNTLNQYVRDAMIAESAKWGDAMEVRDEPLFKRDIHWQAEVDAIAELMDGNVVQFITALRTEGYYPDVDPPTFNQRGGAVASGFTVTLSNPNGSGTIYYTTDGTDPRTVNGGISGNATAYSSPISITDSTTITTRVLDSGDWSAKDRVNFTIAQSPTVSLKAKIFLQGAYDSGSGLMTTTLNTSGYLPLASPYKENPRNVVSMPANITDWVLVELRSTPTGAAVVSKSVLLRNDGLLVDDDGTTESVTLNAAEGKYYVVIKHSSHLAVMSANAISLTETSNLYDFSGDLNQFYGSDGAIELGSNVFGLYGGDCNRDGNITVSDNNLIMTNRNDSGYEVGDINRDGNVTVADNNMCMGNRNKSTQVP